MLLVLDGCAASSARYGRSPSYAAAQSAGPMPPPPPSEPGSMDTAAEAAMAPMSVREESSGGDAEGDSAPAPQAPPAPARAGVASGGARPPARPSPVARGPAGPTTPGRTQPATGTQPAQAAQAAQPAAQPAPMLLYTADVHMTAERAEITPLLDRITDLAYSLGGYLVQRSNNMVRVRVPSARFREGLGRVEGLGEVLQRSINADDVSEEFHDLQVRLANLQAVRARLEQFLARASNVAEALQVERELERVAGEIDRIQGRMRFLSSRAAFSLVTVQVTPRPTIPLPVASPTPPRRLLNLPVPWLDRLGLGNLLQMR